MKQPAERVFVACQDVKYRFLQGGFVFEIHSFGIDLESLFVSLYLFSSKNGAIKEQASFCSILL